MDLILAIGIGGTVCILMAGVIYMIFGEKSIPLAIGCFVFGSILFMTQLYIESKKGEFERYISKDEERAARMFKQNCKLVNFIQGNEKSSTGFGVSSGGSLIVGTGSSSNQDNYIYSCDGNIQYTLTYDIEKYRKFYK